MSYLSGKNSWKETLLEKAGAIHALQKYRLLRQGREIEDEDEGEDDGPLNKMQSLLQIEERLRKMIQRKEALRKKSGEVCDKYQLHAIQKQLDETNREYWILVETWWVTRSAVPSGPLARAFDLWRSHPQWYLHRGGLR